MMLSLLTKRICPLITLALAFGCGKKINEPSAGPNRSTDTTTREDGPQPFQLQLDEAVANFTTYQLTRDAWFNLPAKLIARHGSAVGKRVKIYYGMIGDNFDFYCSYKSISSVTELSLEICKDNTGKEIVGIHDVPEEMSIPFEVGTSIKMKFSNPTNTNLKIESNYLVDWK